MVNIDRHIAISAGWIAGPAFGVAMMAAPEYFHLGPIASGLLFWGGILIFLATIAVVAIVSAHEKNRQSVVLGPIIVMLVGALIFCGGAAWYFWPSSQPKTEAANSTAPIVADNISQAAATHAYNAEEIGARVAILDKVYAVLAGPAWEAYVEGHQLRNSWSFDIPRIGPMAFAEKLSALSKAFGDSFVEIDHILNGPAQYDDIKKLIRDTFVAQGAIYGPIAKFYTDVKRLPPSVSRDTALLPSPQAQDFSKAVDAFEEWINDTKALIAEKRRQELAAIPKQ
jgi:hypothetical protein